MSELFILSILELLIRIPITKHLVLVSIRMYTGEYEKCTVSSVSMDAVNWPWLSIRGCGFSSSMVGPSLGHREGRVETGRKPVRRCGQDVQLTGQSGN